MKNDKYYSEDIINIESASDLGLVPKEFSRSTTKHLVIACDFNLVADEIGQLCSNGKIFSVMSLNRCNRLDRLAEKTDKVPIFYIESKGEGFDIVEKLIEVPYQAIESALNYESVRNRFTEGSPT